MLVCNEWIPHSFLPPTSQKIWEGSHKLSDETHTVEQKIFASTIFVFSSVKQFCDFLTMSYLQLFHGEDNSLNYPVFHVFNVSDQHIE